MKHQDLLFNVEKYFRISNIVTIMQYDINYRPIGLGGFNDRIFIANYLLTQSCGNAITIGYEISVLAQCHSIGLRIG